MDAHGWCKLHEPVHSAPPRQQQRDKESKDFQHKHIDCPVATPYRLARLYDCADRYAGWLPQVSRTGMSKSWFTLRQRGALVANKAPSLKASRTDRTLNSVQHASQTVAFSRSMNPHLALKH